MSATYVKDSTVRLYDDVAKLYNDAGFEIVYAPNTLNVNIKRKSVGYMLKGGTWKWITPVEADRIIPYLQLIQRKNGTYYIDGSFSTNLAFTEIYGRHNSVLYQKICRRMKDGDDLDRLKYLSETTEIVRGMGIATGIERFVAKIEKPMIARYTDNPNKNTFDYITIDCYLVTQFDGDRMAYIQEHIKEINQMVLAKIESNRTFQKYQVPVNILKATNITLRGYILTYRFEVKECDIKQRNCNIYDGKEIL